MKDLSIIIVCYKGWQRLQKCLDALRDYSGNDFRSEVIVVDNKSDDDTIFQIERKYPEFRFIFNSVNGGFANGSSLGAKNATGEYLLFLNPDTVAVEKEVSKLLTVSKQHPEYTILSCKQINENGKESLAYGKFPSIINLTGLLRAIFRFKVPSINIQGEEFFFPDWISGSVVMMRKDIFEKLGGFDEDFWMYFEDVDLCKRAALAGGKTAYIKSAVIEHNHGGSSRINLKTTTITKTEVNISRHVYISKHKRGPERLMIQSFLVLNNIISGGIMALLGMILFFVPKIYSRSLIYTGLLKYYKNSLINGSWISPRSVNSHAEKGK